VDITALVFPEPFEPGLNSYPSRAALLLHLLLHAAGGMVVREVRLVQLHDIARLMAVMNAADWQQLWQLTARAAERSLWWAFPPLALVNRYYACVPRPVLQRAAADCPWALKGVYRRRSLSDVSMSHLWISAFPGIEWAHSLPAMLEYAAARAMPNAETLQLRAAVAQVQPRVSGGHWSQLSQGERVVRWLLARQARQGTLQPVRAALHWNQARGPARLE